MIDLTGILKEDITSNSSKKGIVTYGKKGDKVKIISKRGNVFIVQGKKETFPVNENRLTI